MWWFVCEIHIFAWPWLHWRDGDPLGHTGSGIDHPDLVGRARHSSRGEPRLDLPKAIESVTHVVAAVVHPSSATPLGVVPAAESQAVGDATPTRERSSRAIAAMDGHNCPLRYQCARRIAVTAVISDTNRKQGKQAFAVYR